jgi:hypothetical protein
MKANVIEVSHDEEGTDNPNQVPQARSPVVVHFGPVIPEVLA